MPEIPAERFKLLLTAGAADTAKVEALWSECCARMYSLPPRQRQMGLGEFNGISTYFSANCSETDATVANAFLDSIGLSAYNTRLFKADDGSYDVRIASALAEATGEDAVAALCKEHSFEGKVFRVGRGDYAPLMARVVAALKEAVPHAANAQQTAMLEHYVQSFSLGSIDEHKDASRQWIRDTGPAVESCTHQPYTLSAPHADRS